MRAFLAGLASAIALMIGTVLLYNFFEISMVNQTASSAVHVEHQKNFKEKI